MGESVSRARPCQETYPVVSIIQKQARYLGKIVTLEYGLLDELVSCGLLTSEQVGRIREKTTQSRKIAQFVEELTTDPDLLTQNNERLFSALNMTQHRHVSNFIRSDGIRLVEYGEHWPLIGCDTELTRLDNNRDKFIELVDARNGLLDKLLAAGCINTDQLERIEAGVTDADTNDLLLNTLRRGSLATYNTSIDCLMNTKQHQVASLLSPDSVNTARPLSELQQSRLQTNYDVLLRYMHTKSELLAQLYAADCITERQKEYIEAAVSQTESNKRLVEIMRRGSEMDFKKSIECMDRMGQQHVTRILLEDGVVVPITATIGGTENWECDEVHMDEQITALSRDISIVHSSRLRETVIGHLAELRENAIEILHVKKNTSIDILYLCKSLRGLHYLHDLYDDELLTGMMQELVIVSLNSRTEVSPCIAMYTLQWRTPDYNSCVRNFRVHTETASRVFAQPQLCRVELKEEVSVDGVVLTKLNQHFT